MTQTPNLLMEALALPPLDLNLARELIARTRVSHTLQAYRNVAAASVDEVALVRAGEARATRRRRAGNPRTRH